MNVSPRALFAICATALLAARRQAPSPSPDYAKARGEVEEVIEHAGFVGRSTSAQ